MEGELQRVLGAKVRALRVARHLSQEALADALGVHRTYMGAIERGERNLTLRSIERMAERLGVQPLDLLSPAPREGAGRTGDDRQERPTPGRSRRGG